MERGEEGRGEARKGMEGEERGEYLALDALEAGERGGWGAVRYGAVAARKGVARCVVARRNTVECWAGLSWRLRACGRDGERRGEENDVAYLYDELVVLCKHALVRLELHLRNWRKVNSCRERPNAVGVRFFRRPCIRAAQTSSALPYSVSPIAWAHLEPPGATATTTTTTPTVTATTQSTITTQPPSLPQNPVTPDARAPYSNTTHTALHCTTPIAVHCTTCTALHHVHCTASHTLHYLLLNESHRADG